VGSILALVAFFQPYWNPPSGSIIPPGSLWDYVVLMVFQHHYLGASLVAVSAGLLLLLLLGMVVLAFLALFLRSSRWQVRTHFLRLTTLTLIFYLFAALSDLFSYWFLGTLSAYPGDDSNKETLSLINIGAWLIPLGLLLALIGDVLLKRREGKAGR
jgi:hypothetical protein